MVSEFDCPKKKVKLLFVVQDLQGHGVTISLVNLINAIEFMKYDISLLVFNKVDSVAEKDIPSSVKRISYDNGIELYFQPWEKSLFSLLKLHKWKLIYYRLKVYWDTNNIGTVKALQKNWEQIISSLPNVPGKYDVVVGFQDYFTGVFALEKVNASKFVGWNHNIYQKMGYNDNITEKYYGKLNTLCTISEPAKKSLIQVFGEKINTKIVIVPNAINSKKIDALCKEKVSDAFFETKKRKILSIGRLAYQKGFDFAIKIGSRLKQDGISFMWYILGDGIEHEKLKQLIEKAGLNDSIILYGFAENPYPFIKACDVYVQPSRYEGFGIAISEAYYLNSPLVITPDAGDRFTQSDSICVIPFGDEIQWATAIENIFKNAECSNGNTNGDKAAVLAFNEMISHLMNE